MVAGERGLDDGAKPQAGEQTCEQGGGGKTVMEERGKIDGSTRGGGGLHSMGVNMVASGGVVA